MKHLRAPPHRRRRTPPARTAARSCSSTAWPRSATSTTTTEGIKLLDGPLPRVRGRPGTWGSVVRGGTTSRAKSVPAAIDEGDHPEVAVPPCRHLRLRLRGRAGEVRPGRRRRALRVRRDQVADPRGVAVGPDAGGRRPRRRTVDGATRRRPRWVGQLPERVSVAKRAGSPISAASRGRSPWGSGSPTWEPAVLEAYEGEHVLVAGPPRSGKSTLLLAMVETLRAGAAADGQDLAVWGICGRRSPLATAGLDRVRRGRRRAGRAARRRCGSTAAAWCSSSTMPRSTTTPTRRIAGLLAARPTDLLVIAAGRSDDLRGLYHHFEQDGPQVALRGAAAAQRRLRRRPGRGGPCRGARRWP